MSWSEDWESYAIGYSLNSIAGWSTSPGSTDPRVITDGGGNRAGLWGAGGYHVAQRTITEDGDLSYDYLVGGGETLAVYVNSSFVVSHSGSGSNSIALTSGDIIEFRFQSYYTPVWIDNLDFVASGGASFSLTINDIDLVFETESFVLPDYLAVNDIDLGFEIEPVGFVSDVDLVFEIESPALSIGTSIAINDIDFALELESPSVELNTSLAINDIDLGFEAESPSVAVNWKSLAINDVDAKFEIEPVTVYFSADLYVNDLELELEIEQVALTVHIELSIDDVDLVFETESIDVTPHRILAINDVDLVFETESIDLTLHAPIEIDDVDLVFEAERPRVIVNGGDNPLRSRLFLTGTAFIGTKENARLLFS